MKNFKTYFNPLSDPEMPAWLGRRINGKYPCTTKGLSSVINIFAKIWDVYPYEILSEIERRELQIYINAYIQTLTSAYKGSALPGSIYDLNIGEKPTKVIGLTAGAACNWFPKAFYIGLQNGLTIRDAKNAASFWGGHTFIYAGKWNIAYKDKANEVVRIWIYDQYTGKSPRQIWFAKNERSKLWWNAWCAKNRRPAYNLAIWGEVSLLGSNLREEATFEDFCQGLEGLM